jgi:hypothetical protein
MAEPAIDPLLAELRSVVEKADPIPDAVVSAAKASFIWRTIDAELAELVTDSLFTSPGIRSDGGARLLTFEGPGVEVEVEVADTGRSRHLTGQLVPVRAATIAVRWSGGSVDTQTDDLGRFSISDVPAGAVSLAITDPAQGHTVVTSWVSI